MKIRVSGYSPNEGSRVFEILERGELEKIIDSVDQPEIFCRTFEKAQGYHFSGDAYTFVDARDGKIVTRWQQQGMIDHPWDSFYEVVICSIKTPVVEFDTDAYLDNEEMEKFCDSYMSLEEFLLTEYGPDEFERRTEAIVDFYSHEFKIDWDFIKEQLDNLYRSGC